MLKSRNQAGLILVAALVVVGCGKTDFSSKGNPAPAVERTGQETTATGKPGAGEPYPSSPSTGKPGSGTPPGGLTPGGGSNGDGSGKPPGLTTDGDQNAIAGCLKAWGQHPFGPNPVASRHIHASVQVLGFGSAIRDDYPTAGPELVVISAAVGVMSNSKMELLNPNGWYCLKVDVNVLNNTQIDLACRAHLADSRVNVGVLSNNDPAGVVGVHVLSDVKVVRRPGC